MDPEADTAAFAPLGRVIDTSDFPNGDAPLRTPWHETIVYELHVKGFTQQHPDLPEKLRRHLAGLASAPAIAHLRESGVTAIELLPVHYHVDEHFLVERGRTNLGLQHPRVSGAGPALCCDWAGRRGGRISRDGA